jgi:formylglycine-generating enzyme required for sulfatase activity
VVRIFDHGVMDDGTAYIVMELLEGESLHDRIAKEGQLSPDDVVRVVDHVAKALDRAHVEGVIHRDVKPQNIFLSSSGGEIFGRLVDFGVAKFIESEEPSELTEPGMVAGTLEYLSRELLMGAKEVDAHDDLWALAVVAYKSLTGVLPFRGKGIGELCKAIMEGTFRRPSKLRDDVPAAVDGWFVRAFWPEPAKRFANGSEMASTLRSALAGDVGDLPSGTTRPRRVRWWMVAAPAALLGTLALTVARRSPPPQETETAAAQPSAHAGALADADASASAAASASAMASASPSAVQLTADGQPLEVLVEEGEAWMGCHQDRSTECADDEHPGRRVYVGSFFIDRLEVSVADYRACSEGGGCNADDLIGFKLDGGAFTPSAKCNWGRPDRNDHPLNCVTHAQALAYCEQRGGRLPTEAEWEKAARGTDRRRFPWAGEPTCSRAVMGGPRMGGCGKDSTWPVGSMPRGKSPFGVLNMAGNVREWVSDWYDAEYYRGGPTRDPAGPDQGTRRSQRGGNWANAVGRFMRTSARFSSMPDSRSVHVGFRCARSAP